MALRHYEEIVAGRVVENDDTKNYIFEAVMELLGKEIWSAYNHYRP